MLLQPPKRRVLVYPLGKICSDQRRVNSSSVKVTAVRRSSPPVVLPSRAQNVTSVSSAAMIRLSEIGPRSSSGEVLQHLLGTTGSPSARSVEAGCS